IAHFGIPTGGVGDPGPTVGGKKVDGIDGIRKPVSLEIAVDERDHVLDLRSLLGNKAIAKPAINLNALGLGFGSEDQFLQLARAFEDTGVSAYSGAAPLIQSHDIVGYAARILAVEGYHAGNIRLMAALKGLSTFKVDSKDVLPPPSGPKYFFTDSQALAIPRTVAEVIAIVKPFFPDGLNGNIK
ncbi:MAG: ferritin-like domain-containing protein, partial [Candidatus Eremiobacteraeota bacterium]|nr:ferritin-like domain-containing protein [Candidatus Eremiobacteraeota bacterium]